MNLWRMVIPLVTLCLLFLLQLPSALADDMTGGNSCGSAVVLPEQIFQPMHQPGSGQKYRGIAVAAYVVNQILCIDIALRRRQLQPVKALPCHGEHQPHKNTACREHTVQTDFPVQRK